jgi:hypothetical protein
MGDFLEKIISNCNHFFFKKVVYINNVNNIKEVLKYAKIKVDEGVIDEFYIVDDYAESALKHFDLDENSFNGGYNYSISELVGIYLCETDFLLHFSSDSFMLNSDFDWISDSVNMLSLNEEYLVANPIWNGKIEEVEAESFFESDNFFVSFGFSDQCYLIKVKQFKDKIYNQTNKDSERYPEYGGELFEKKVDSFMRNNNLFRIIPKDVSYYHINYPRNLFLYRFNAYVYYIVKKRLNIKGMNK